MVAANCAIKHTQQRLTLHEGCEVAVKRSRLFVGFRTNTMSLQSYISSKILTLYCLLEFYKFSCLKAMAITQRVAVQVTELLYCKLLKVWPEFYNSCHNHFGE